MSNLKYCDKCQHSYLAEDGHDCSAEPQHAYHISPGIRDDIPFTWLDAVGTDGCKATTEVLKKP